MKLWQKARDADNDGETIRSGPISELQLPEAPHPVKLILAGGERMPAQIGSRDGGDLVVLMLYPLRQPLREAEKHTIVIEIADGEETTCLGGTATMQDMETLRFTDLHFVQRREYVRVKASLPVHVSLDGELDAIQCTTVDLSGGGMLVRDLGHLLVGERIHVRIVVDPDEPPIAGRASILRTDANGRTAVCFETISEGDRRRLIRFLFECQREERRKGLRPEGSYVR